MVILLMIAETCYGIETDIGIWRWNGHAFNPSAEYQTWNPYTESWEGFDSWLPTTSFNLLNYRYGNEAICFAFQIYSASGSDSGYMYVDYYDPDNNLLFSASYYFTIPDTNYWYAVWSGIGIKGGDSEEIWKNGTYSVAWSAVGEGNTISGYVYPVVTNYPTATFGDAGHIWVEGTLLAFCCYQNDAKILCNHDGVSYATGLTAYQGHIWLETNGKISYIDNAGTERRTKMGDQYGNPADPYELPGSGLAAYAGHIWVSSGYYTDTFLCIISSDGIKYRIGVGAIASLGDYQ